MLRSSQSTRFSPFRTVDCGALSQRSTPVKKSKPLHHKTPSSGSMQKSETAARLRLTLFKTEGDLASTGRTATARTGSASARSNIPIRPCSPLFAVPSKQKRMFAFVRSGDISGLRSISHTLSTDDINSPDSRHNTALFYAAQCSVAMCALLLQLGARVNVSCEDGNTPLHAAFAADRDDVVVYFVLHGADLAKKNKAGNDPARCASDRLCAVLGLIEGKAVTFTPQQLILTLRQRQRSTRPQSIEPIRIKKPNIVLYQFPKSVMANRILLREKNIRKHAPLYPSPMKSGVKFTGECLSPSIEVE